jgi:hypothetical protein
MKKSMFIRGLAALVACALVLPVVGSLKNPVERPFQATGASAMNPDGTFLIVGTATHLGKFVFPGTYEITWAAPDFSKIVFHILGTYTAANGDTINIECKEWVFTADPPTSTGLVKILSGTGRFANASGSYVGTLSPAATPTLFTAEGTISY